MNIEIKLAKNYGFCFGVERAIELSEKNPNSSTIGPIIHNPREIARLKKDFSVDMVEDEQDINNLKENTSAIVRTHGIPKEKLDLLKSKNINVIDATCPYVTKIQKICEKASKDGYEVVIFGDANHPEVKGIRSYAGDKVYISLDVNSLKKENIANKVILVSQTTKKQKEFEKIADYLKTKCSELKVHDTICDATLKNQDAIKELSKDVDTLIVIGGLNSSNTKELYNISKENCQNTFLVSGSDDIEKSFFNNSKICGISAGASTPKWIIDEVISKIKNL